MSMYIHQTNSIAYMPQLLLTHLMMKNAKSALMPQLTTSHPSQSAYKQPPVGVKNYSFLQNSS